MPVDIDALVEGATYAKLRRAMAILAEAKGEWAGLPLPIDGHEMTVEKTFPHASLFDPPRPPDPDPIDVRNSFWSSRYRVMVHVMREDGRATHFAHASTRTDRFIKTMHCLDAWDLDQETNALRLASELLSEQQFKCYILTGAFFETSSRSGARYMFRRLRPTLALSPSTLRPVAALCMHPIGYYKDTWAGVMCPTDDVIAHVSLMRADERLFWARCNQHAPWRPEADID